MGHAGGLGGGGRRLLRVCLDVIMLGGVGVQTCRLPSHQITMIQHPRVGPKFF